MNAPAPLLQTAVAELFASWLRDCQEQVAAHLAGNGDGVDAPTLAEACPATFGESAVAAWVLEGNGDRARVDAKEG